MPLSIKKVLGTVLAISLLGGLLTVTHSQQAQADTTNNVGSQNTTNSSAPTQIDITTVVSSTSSFSIKISLDQPLEQSNSTLVLYNINSNTEVASFTEGDSIPYQAYRMDSDYRLVAKIQESGLESNWINIPSRTSLNPTISVSASTFATEDTTPSLSWSMAQSSTAYGKYLVDITDNKIISAFSNRTTVTSGSALIPRFYSGPRHLYALYIGDYGATVGNSPTTITGIKGISSAKSIARAKWNASVTSSVKSFGTADATPSINWAINQSLSATNNAYTLYVCDTTTSTILGRYSSSAKSGSFPINRFYKGNAHQYTAFIAATKSTTDTTCELSDVQTTSNIESISRANWNVSATISSSEFSTTDPTPVVTWSANQPLDKTNGSYSAYIVDETSKKIVKQFSAGTTGNSQVIRFTTGDPHSYDVYIAESNSAYTQPSQFTDIQAISSTLSTARTSWTATLSVDKNIYSYNDTPPQFTIQANQPTTSGNNGVGYALYIFDITANKRVYYTAYGATSQTIPAPAVYDNRPHLYRLYVAAAEGTQDYTALKEIQTASEDTQIQQQNWVVNSSIDKNSFSTTDYGYQTSNRMPVISWNVNQNVTAAGGNITVYLVNETTRKVISSSTKTSGNFIVPGFTSGDAQTYNVYVAQSATGKSTYTIADLNIQGQGVGKTVSRTPWTIDISAPETFKAGRAPYVTYDTNQQLSLDDSAYFGPGYVRTFGYYGAYLVDVTTNEIFYADNKTATPFDAKNDEATSKWFAPLFYTGGPHQYQAIIAKYDSSATKVEDLQDIQAKSKTISISREPWSVALNMTDRSSDSFWFEGNFNQLVPLTNKAYETFLVYTNSGRIAQTLYSQKFYAEDNVTMSYYDKPDQNTSITQPYKLYVAAYNPDATNVSQLTDIQAVSGPTFLNANGGPVQNGETMGGSNPSESNCQSCQGDPINTYTGEFFESRTDLSFSTNVPLDFTRTYSSANAKIAGDFGKGWISNYSMKLTPAAGIAAGTTISDAATLTVSQENGSTVSFIKDSFDNTYMAPYRVHASLQKTPEGFILTRNNGYQFLFDITTGYLKSISDRDNNNLQVTTGTDGKVFRIAADSGQWINVTWADGHIIELDDSAGRSSTYAYDANGNLLTTTTPAAVNPSSYTYNSSSLLTSETYPNGGVTTNIYANGKVVKQTDPMGNVTTFNYYSPTITDTTLPNGSTTREVYNSQGQLISQTKAFGTSLAATTTYSYGSTSQVVKETNPDGYSVSYTYDSNGNTTSTRDPNGNITSYYYNQFNQVTKVVDPNGGVTTASYDSKGNLLSTTSAEGRTTKYTFNQNGTKSSILAPNQVAAKTNKLTKIGYDASGYVNSSTSPNGNTTNVTNDPVGRIVAAYDPQGHKTSFEYNQAGQPTKTTDSTGTASNLYDNAGLLLKTTDQLGFSTNYVYDLNGNIIKKTTLSSQPTENYIYDSMGSLSESTVKAEDGEARISSIVYNELQQPVSVTDPMGNIVTEEWSIGGRLLAETDAMGKKTTYQYDPNGNVLSVTNPDGDVSSATYTKLNQLATTTSAAGSKISYVYDKDGNTIKATKNDGSTTAYSYDANGNVLTSTDAMGVLSSNSYDDEDNLTQETVSGKTTTYSYNNLNQNISTTRSDNSVVNFHYNDSGSVTGVSYDNWATTESSYTYDALQRVLQETKNGTTTSYSYDDAGNVTSRGPPSRKVYYNYDKFNQLQKLQYPNGTYSEYSYNANGDLLSVLVDGSIPAVSYHYDKNSQVTSADYGNGTTQSYAYNNAGQATNTTVSLGGNQLYKQDQTLNKDGFITARTDGDSQNNTSNKSYIYDALNRIKTVNTGTNSTDYVFNARNQLTTAGPVTNSYDADGSLTSSVNVSSNTQTSYAYDGRGNRTSKSVTKPSVAPDTASIATTEYDWTADDKLQQITTATAEYAYTYDNEGLVSNKTTQTSSGSETNQFTWDTETGLPTLLEDGSYSYVYGSSDTPVAQINSNTGEVSYLASDIQGSVILLTDSFGGKKADYAYDAYGNTEQSNDIDHLQTHFGYAGQYLDTDANLYNLRARWYEPGTGGFLSVDPLLSETGDSYGYGSGNPISYNDPTGLSTSNNMTNLGQMGFGLLDGATGGISTGLINLINPSLISTCNIAFRWGSTGGSILSFFVPGDAFFRVLGSVSKGIKSISKVSTIVKGGSQLTKVDEALLRANSKMPLHIIWEGESPKIAALTRKAWSQGAPDVLTYSSVEARRINKLTVDQIRGKKISNVKSRPGFQRDEYPYASTREGDGTGPYMVELVPTPENQQQAVDLNNLYTKLLKRQDGAQFRVVIMPGKRPDQEFSPYYFSKRKNYGMLDYIASLS